jgi:uncharacterized protein (DUF952 family)
MTEHVIKIVRADELSNFRDTGLFLGSVDDQNDGFIHLSRPSQIAGSLRKHFSNVEGVGETELSLLYFAQHELGNGLKWEISRDKEMFPHFYGNLKWEQVERSVMLEVDLHGRHILPDKVTVC